MTERWFAGRGRLRIARLVALLAPLVGVSCLWVGSREPDRALAALFLLNGVVQLALGGLCLLAVRHRGRPVLELSDQEVVYGSLFRYALRRLPIREIAEVGEIGRSPLPAFASLVLTTRSGERVRIGVGALSRSDRRAVRAALESRVCALC